MPPQVHQLTSKLLSKIFTKLFCLSKMALKTSVAVLLSLNLVFFATLSSSSVVPPAAPTPQPSSSSVVPPAAPTPQPSSSTVVPPAAPTPQPSSCPIDILKLRACASLLGGFVSVGIGSPAQPCCSLLDGLADLDAALCLCTALKADVLGINLDIPVSLSPIFKDCGKRAPSGFQCP